MGIKGQMVINPGVYTQERQQGEILLSAASRLADEPLALIQRNLDIQFFLPQLLYDVGLGYDPAQQYAVDTNMKVPVTYWNAPYKLVNGLRAPHMQMVANRILGVNADVARGILNMSRSSLYFDPASGKACRLEYQVLDLYDFNAPKVGQLMAADVTVKVHAWSLKYESSEYLLMADEKKSGIPVSFMATSRALQARSHVNEAVTMITRGEHEQIKEALEATAMEHDADTVPGNDPSRPCES